MTLIPGALVIMRASNIRIGRKNGLRNQEMRLVVPSDDREALLTFLEHAVHCCARLYRCANVEPHS